MKARLLAFAAAASLIAATTSGATAQGLPLSGDDFDYQDICKAFGPGYFAIPGTQTCMKVSGRVRTDYNAYVGDFDRSGDPGDRRTGDADRDRL